MIGTITIVAAIAAAAIGFIIKRIGLHWFYVAAKTSKRDLLALFAYIRLLILVRNLRNKNATIYDVFETNVKKQPNKIAIQLCDDNNDDINDVNNKLTFLQLYKFSNNIAKIFSINCNNIKYTNGDCVALLLDNSPEYIGIELGLSKLGIIIPLINTNLRNKSLLHSITIANCKGIIYGDNYQNHINDIKTDLYSKNIKLYKFNRNTYSNINEVVNDEEIQINNDKNIINLTKLLNNYYKKTDDDDDNDGKNDDNDGKNDNAVKINHNDKLLYIYTSGTTGLPKAAVITHARYIFICAGIHYTLNMKLTDIYYTPLPLYHTAGGIMSIGQCIVFGSTVIIRKKFSAKNYFADCQKYNCTVSQYIGEMCRYILSTPNNTDIDTKHSIRLCFGNGLRTQIWEKFTQRFNIKQIGEFYGATEGNANISNTDGTIGAIGFISRIIPTIYPITIIKANQETGEPIRDAHTNLCQICKANEPGIFIGKIIPNNPSREFLGYVDQSASEKKIIKNVFRTGDTAFSSGDILIADDFGYLYFIDRTGDTFRWKGENCSTNEIEAQLSNLINYLDVIVYGIAIPFNEGKAGMAAIHDPNNSIQNNIIELSNNIKLNLPSYARPIFLRFLNKIDLTGTFKLRKIDLQRDGFNPNIIKNDKLYYLSKTDVYEELTIDIYNDIINNKIRF